MAVAIDPHRKLHYGQDHAMGDHVIAVLCEGVPDAYLAELRAEAVSYLFAGPDGDDLLLAFAGGEPPGDDRALVVATVQRPAGT